MGIIIEYIITVAIALRAAFTDGHTLHGHFYLHVLAKVPANLCHFFPVMDDTRFVDDPALITLGVSCRDVEPAHEGFSLWFVVSYWLVNGRLLSIPVMRLMPSV